MPVPPKKTLFQLHEQKYINDVLLNEFIRYQLLWRFLGVISKFFYYLTHPADLLMKVKFYVWKRIGKDTLQISMPDTFIKAYQRKTVDYFSWTNKGKNSPQVLSTIDTVLNSKRYKGILIYPTTIPWEPLQRPQQLMREFAKLGYLCFYCENYDAKFYMIRVAENLFRISGEQYLIYPLSQQKVIVLCTWMLNLPFVNALQDYILWYDIIDQLEIFSLYDEDMKSKHEKVVQAADIITYSARNLQELAEGRQDAVYLPNGVIVEDFWNKSDSLDNDPYFNLLKSLKDQNKPIVGFYGAIAEWVDLDLIQKIAEARKDLAFVMIGRTWISSAKVECKPNIHIFGPVPYKKLPYYASTFDVAMIPFTISKLTDSVSPIKFFEYAALGLPIVATPFYEIVQYSSEPFIRLAKDSDAFLASLDELIRLKNLDMAKAARQFAMKNHWKERVTKVDGIIRNIY